MFVLPLLMIVAQLAGATGAAAVTNATAAAPLFSAAELAPADTSFYMEVAEAATIRRQLAECPIADGLAAATGGGLIRHAWRDLAARADMEPDAFFDRYLGQRVVVIGRATEAGHQWTLLSTVDAEDARSLKLALRPKLRGPRSSVDVVELPEDDMLLARHGSWMVVGPRANAGLFDEVLSTLDDAGPPRASLADQSVVARGRSMGAGQVGLLMAHPESIGGWSAVVGRVDGRALTLQHAAHFERSPLTRRVTSLRCDFSPLANLDQQMILTVLEPTDVSDAPGATFLTVLLGEPLINRSMRHHLGDRRILAVGELEGRTLEPPVDVRTASMALCLEVDPDSRDAALGELDGRMDRLVTQLNDLGDGAFTVHCPGSDRLPPEVPRTVDIGSAAEWLTDGLPATGNLSLNWTVTDGPHGAWCVIATHRPHLDEVVQCLGPGERRSPPLVGRYDSVGSADGVRLGAHLASWANRADLFTDPPDTTAFQKTMRLISGLASGVQRCRWKLARPSVNEMRLEVELQLQPPPSRP